MAYARDYNVFELSSYYTKMPLGYAIQERVASRVSFYAGQNTRCNLHANFAKEFHTLLSFQEPSSAPFGYSLYMFTVCSHKATALYYYICLYLASMIYTSDT